MVGSNIYKLLIVIRIDNRGKMEELTTWRKAFV
jgi:hypothetical protein